MKKIFGIIFLILCFGVIDKVEATSCLYYNETHDVHMAIYLRVTQAVNSATGQYEYVVKNLESLDINDEHYDIYDTWERIELVDANGVKRPVFIDNLDTCPNYMYLDANAYWFDYIFLSDSDYIEEDWDMKLELIGPYNNSTEKAILNEMVCTYNMIPDSLLAGHINHYPPYLTFTFKIRDNGNGSGSYELYGDYEKLYENNYENYMLSYVDTEIEDQFSIRNFWSENTGVYTCPDAIFVSGSNEGIINLDKKIILGYNHGDPDLDEYINSNWFATEVDYNYVFYRSEGASYIDYQTSDANQGQICNYIREQEGDYDKWYIALAQYTPINEQYYYVAYFNDKLGFENRPVTFRDIPQDVIIESCDDLPIIYTDCLNVSNGASCTVSQSQFSNKDSNGNELVEKLVEGEWLNSQDIFNALAGLGAYTGYQYKQFVCELKDRLEVLPNYNYTTLYKVKPLQFYNYDGTESETVKIDDINCESWLVETNFDCDDECEQQIDYLVEKKIREITTYCQNKYSNFSVDDLANGAYKGRMHECIAFNEFYSSLVSSGLVRDLSSSCKMLSNDFVDKLDWILDILQIAGPILAVGLGTLDFIKVVASGDADKEMKNAFKKFSIRIVSAILLFIVPVILAFLMDTFLGNQDGYDSDNPFCGMVDWSE